MSNQNVKTHRNFWESPWGYAESFFIGIGLILSGFAIEVVTTNSSLESIVFPYSIYLLVGYILLLITFYISGRNTLVVQWLIKIPASITSIVLITLLVMIMGIIPQTTSDSEFISSFGLNRITSNWAFLFILVFFLSCLGMVIINRIALFKWSDVGFVLNHLGLFIALIAGTFGIGDLQRMVIEVNENQANFIAVDKYKNEFDLDFAIYLEDFVREEYNPKIAIVDNNDGQIISNNGINSYLIIEGNTYSFKNYSIEIMDYLESAARFGDSYHRNNEIGSPPAVKIKVTNNDIGDQSVDWISCGSFTQQYLSYKLNAYYSIVMTIPEVKKFESNIQILTKDGERIPVKLEVNKPYTYEGWKLYQYGYDETKAKWSTKSIIELVRDPWLPFVYLGIFMMILGSVYIFWVGSKISGREEK